jgi:hypothetical protein
MLDTNRGFSVNNRSPIFKNKLEKSAASRKM